MDPLFQALSLMILHTSMEQKEFVSRFRLCLAHTARKEFPKASIAELSQKIGMLRGTIAEFLDSEFHLKIPPSNEMHILNDLWKIRDQNDLVNLKGERSFYTIAKKQLVGKHSPETALNTLIKCKSVAHHGDNKLLVKSQRMSIGNDEKQLARIISDVCLKLVKTVLKNAASTEKNYQNSIVTRSVPPQSIPVLHQEVFDYMKKNTMVELRKLIEAYEDPGFDHYPEYSVSAFEFF